jgi:hypothetical protein
MKTDKGTIEFIYEGGSGGEANVRIELRTEFPGLGGTLVTNEGVASAMREELKPSSKSGHKMYLRHMIIKKLDDYFYRKGVYKYSHVPRPFGSISQENGDSRQAYIYEWAFGSEGFPWEYPDKEGNTTEIILHDWKEFVEHFHSAGIDMKRDIADTDDARISKNIIHQYPVCVSNELEMCSLWKRIDFGFDSTPINLETLQKFLNDNRKDLNVFLRFERVEMMVLAVKYLINPKELKEIEIGKLEVLVGDYRRWSLCHYTSHGMDFTSSLVGLVEGKESLV